MGIQMLIIDHTVIISTSFGHAALRKFTLDVSSFKMFLVCMNSSQVKVTWQYKERRFFDQTQGFNLFFKYSTLHLLTRLHLVDSF